MALRVLSDFRSFTSLLEGIPKGNDGGAKWYREELKSVRRLRRNRRKFYCEPSRRATGLRNDGVRVLYDEPSKMRPKTTRSNGWIELNEAKVRNIELRVDLSKNATQNERLSLERDRDGP